MMSANLILWAGIGLAAGYAVKYKLQNSDVVRPAISVPYSRYPYVDPKVVYSRAGVGLMEFSSFEDKGKDQYGTPIQYWSLANGSKVRMFGKVNQDKLRRYPATVHGFNSTGFRGRSNSGRTKLDKGSVDGKTHYLKPQNV